MKPSQIIHEGDVILEQIPNLDKRLYKVLTKFIYRNAKDNKVKIKKEDLAGLEDALYKEVKDSEYQLQLIKYLALFDQLSRSISEQQSEINQLKVDEVQALWAQSDLNSNIMDKVVYSLGKQGIKEVFVKGLADAVRDTNFFNLDTDSAVERLRKFVVEDEYTKRYLEQTVFDALSQYQGAMNNQIRIAYGFKRMQYFTGLIETSRPICRHLKADPDKLYTEEELKAVLEEFCPKGHPSETLVKGKRKYVDKDGNVTFKEAMVKKGSGMIDPTTFENFYQVRGGWRCRHEAIPRR